MLRGGSGLLQWAVLCRQVQHLPHARSLLCDRHHALLLGLLSGRPSVLQWEELLPDRHLYQLQPLL
jgi:hypothetical protein